MPFVELVGNVYNMDRPKCQRVSLFRPNFYEQISHIFCSLLVRFLDMFFSFDDQNFTCPIGQVDFNILIFYLPDTRFYLPRASGQALVSSPAIAVRKFL